MNQKTRKRIVIFLPLFTLIYLSFTMVMNLIFPSLSLPKSNTSSEEINSGDAIILEYYIWDDEASYITPVVDTYNAMQNSVQVNLHLLGSSYYEKDIADLLSSDVPVDLIGIKGISKMVQTKENLLDLTSYIQSNSLDVTSYGTMFNEIAVDNKYYGIPTRNTAWALFYNKDIFDAAHIPYPDQLTWEEYRSLAITLTHGEGASKIYGGYWVPWCYNFAALQHSSYLIDDDLSYLQQSLELLNTFYNVDGSHMSYTDMEANNINPRDIFESGRIAMMPQGEWFVTMLLQDEKSGLSKVNWDIAPIPVFEGQNSRITWGQYEFVCISSSTQYPKETFDFITFLCGEEGARIYASNGMIHAYSDEPIKELYLDTVKKNSASIFYETKKVQEQLALSGYDTILDAFKQCAESYFVGDIDLDTAIANFDAMRRHILSP